MPNINIAENVKLKPIENIEDITFADVENSYNLEEPPIESIYPIEENIADAAHADTLEKEADLQNNSCEACPHVLKQDNINPFPSVFPNSEWVKISYPGPAGWWHYISGKIFKDSTLVAKVLGVPGEYGMAPPIWLEGFGTYMRCFTEDAKGYWLMFQDADTGEVLDPSLSPHDE